jgi:phosphoribosylformylglycinamidine synthase
LVGKTQNDLGSSQYIAKLKGVEFSPCPYFDLDEEYAVQMAVYNAITSGLLQSAHDVSEGGLFIAALESAMAGNLGFDLCTEAGLRLDAALFGESQSRVLVSVKPENKAAFESAMNAHKVPCTHIGTVAASNVVVNGAAWGGVETFAQGYQISIESALS